MSRTSLDKLMLANRALVVDSSVAWKPVQPCETRCITLFHGLSSQDPLRGQSICWQISGRYRGPRATLECSLAGQKRSHRTSRPTRSRKGGKSEQKNRRILRLLNCIVSPRFSWHENHFRRPDKAWTSQVCQTRAT